MSEAERIEALEFRCAYLEKTMQDLSDELYRHQQLLLDTQKLSESLGRQLALLESRMIGPDDAEAEA